MATDPRAPGWPGVGGNGPHFDERGLPPGYPFRPDWEVTPREVKAMLDRKEEFLFIDCRTEGEYRVARIEGGRLLPLHELVARLGELAGHEGQKVVVYCHHGGRSLQAASLLKQRGFTHARSMAGGIDLWSMGVDRSVPRY